ncbi:MAG: hypothetical protein HXX14_01775 [Bacteroidetes bacterium]|nr:hypothetical protein [Bacteroidota bacterium]
MRMFYLCLCLCFCLFSCSSKSEKKGNENTSVNSNSSNYSDNSKNNSNYSEDSENNKDDENNSENEISSDNDNGCKYKDGTYSATVDYNNPETGYSQTYTLDVEVRDCQVVQINFPKGGYLDEDHISPADLDENGNASVEGEDGKTYEIQID